MGFMNYIVDRFNYLGDLFYELYLDCYYAGWPLELLDTWFYAISGYFYNLAWDFSDFGDWVSTVQARIVDILSWSTIWNSILSYVPNLEAIRDWFYSWTTNIVAVVNGWWSYVQTNVQGWIDIAVSGLQGQISAVNTWLANIQAFIDELQLDFPDVSGVLDWFTNWTGNVTQVINGWWTTAMVEVQDLINSAFIIRGDFWAGWQDWRDKVAEFFTDPEDWLYKSFDRIIERFW